MSIMMQLRQELKTVRFILTYKSLILILYFIYFIIYIGDIEVDVNIDTNPPLFCTGYDFTYDMAKQRAALSIMRVIKRKCSQVENDSVFH